MQRTLAIKLGIIIGLCILFAIGLNLFSSVIYERQSYADSVVRQIAEQHVNPQEVITPFIAIPATVTPECLADPIDNSVDKAANCPASYSKVETIFAAQTQARQNFAVSTDTYKRGIYQATSYNGAVKFNQSYSLKQTPFTQAEPTVNHWNDAKLIIPVSDLRGVTTLPTVTINKQSFKATYPETPMLKGLSYVEVALPQDIVMLLTTQEAATTAANPNITAVLNSDEQQSNEQSRVKSSTTTENIEAQNSQPIAIIVDLPLVGISNLNTVPTGQNFELAMQSNWHAPNFIGQALPNAKSFTKNGFDANWQNQYLTIANNQRLTQCLNVANNGCSIVSDAYLDMDNYVSNEQAAMAVVEAGGAVDSSSVSLNSFGVSFAEPNDVYLQTERTMKYALLLILVSFGTFFLFEIIKSSRIHPIQYLLVGCALLVFYVLLLPLAEQIAFWQAYAIAASACVGLIGWYTYYVLTSVKRAIIFTAILAGLYAAFYGILTTEDLNLLLGAVFCFVVLASVMVMTRKIDWYKIA